MEPPECGVKVSSWEARPAELALRAVAGFLPLEVETLPDSPESQTQHQGAP